MLTIDWEISFAALILGLGLAGWMYWLEKRPRTDLKPRLFPTTLFLFLGGLLAIAAGMHLLSLAGFQRPPTQP